MQEMIKDMAQALGYVYKQTTERPVTGLAVDSRAVQQGDLFVALVGEQTDGHKYLRQALGARCSGSGNFQTGAGGFGAAQRLYYRGRRVKVYPAAGTLAA